MQNKEALIGVIGLGYVGLPLSLSYAENKIRVLGFDIDKNKISTINNGKSYFQHITNKRIKENIDKNLLHATNDFSKISELDAIIICVPTPLTKNKEPDLSFIKNTLSSILKYIRPGQILSLESTTYPGTTEEVLMPLIVSKGFQIGKDFFLVYSPEREDPGNKKFNTSTIPKVLGGITNNCSEVGLKLYKHATSEVVKVSNTRTAEFTKLLENIHRAVNIGLMNELKPLAEKMDVDLYEIIKAASTKPFGYVPYYPGPGLGGHCLPIDPFYLTWKAREYDMHTRFIELSGEINDNMPHYVVQKSGDLLNKFSKSLKNSKILILGISYKKNIDDTRESPSLKIMELLTKKGAKVEYSDPFFVNFPKSRNYSFNLKSIDITSKSLAEFDAVILATDHDEFDYELIRKNSKLIVDTRGRFGISDCIVRG